MPPSARQDARARSPGICRDRDGPPPDEPHRSVTLRAWPPPSAALFRRPGGPRMPGAFRSCSQYADTIDNAWSDAERYRMLISDLPRRFHAASRELQALSLEEPPAADGHELGRPARGGGRAHRDHPRPPRAGLVRRSGAVAQDLLDADSGVRQRLPGDGLPRHARRLSAARRHHRRARAGGARGGEGLWSPSRGIAWRTRSASCPGSCAERASADTSTSLAAWRWPWASTTGATRWMWMR